MPDTQGTVRGGRSGGPLGYSGRHMTDENRGQVRYSPLAVAMFCAKPLVYAADKSMFPSREVYPL